MRKLLMGLALSLVVTTASAEWVLVSTTSSGDKTYSDPMTKKRMGNMVRVWEINDYVAAEVFKGKAYQSDRAYVQYDCVESTVQHLQIALFAGKMATGELIESENKPGDKSFVAPGTVANLTLEFACR